MELTFEFFDRIKADMQKDAIIKIIYRMKKHSKKMRKKRMDAEAKKLAAK